MSPFFSAVTDVPAPVQAATAVIDMKKIKPRVDTHWSGAVPLRSGTVQRTSSLRSSKPSAVTSAVNQMAAVPVPRLTRTRVGQTATLQTAKLTTLPSVRPKIDDKIASTATTTITTTLIRRQESNLTRKSLTKLKAADAAAKLAKERTTAVQAPSQQQYIAAPMPVPASTAHSEKMLLDFDDVDAGDEENPLLVSEYVNDIYAYLYHLEEKYAIRKNHLDGQRDVFPKMRAVLIDWINEVHLQYRFAQETFHMAVSIIDRYLQVSSLSHIYTLIPCIYFFCSILSDRFDHIATKSSIGRCYCIVVSIQIRRIVSTRGERFRIYHRRHLHTGASAANGKAHFEGMPLINFTNSMQLIWCIFIICQKLKFELGCPLSINFLRRYSKIASSPGDTHLLSKYFIELCSVEYSMSHYRPSQVIIQIIHIIYYTNQLSISLNIVIDCRCFALHLIVFDAC